MVQRRWRSDLVHGSTVVHFVSTLVNLRRPTWKTGCHHLGTRVLGVWMAMDGSFGDELNFRILQSK
jgi:hypothetical protein